MAGRESVLCQIGWDKYTVLIPLNNFMITDKNTWNSIRFPRKTLLLAAKLIFSVDKPKLDKTCQQF